MDIAFGWLILFLNGIFTLFCGSTILYFISTKRLEQHLFYISWSLGFLVYGIQLVSRALFFPILISGLQMVLALILFLLGIWSLSRRRDFLFLFSVTCSLLFLVIIFGFYEWIQYDICIILSLFIFYFSIITGVLYHRVIFGKILDKFALGWALLLLSNLIFLISGWICDALAIFSKSIIPRRIMDYDFIILTERVRRGFGPYLPPIDTGARKEGGFKLIISSRSSYLEEIDWIMRRVQDNVERGENTYIFSFQDKIPHRELRRLKWVSPERIFVFLFSMSAEKAKKEFTVLPIGITEVGAALSEIVKQQKVSEKSCTVIFSDLSLLIHLFGVYSVYYLLLNKMGSIREEGVDLYAFFHPETHSDKSIVSLFTNISDEVIKS